MNADDRQAVRQLLSSFAERPIEVLDPIARASRRARTLSGIQAVLNESNSRHSKGWNRWSAVGAGLALAAGVVLAVGYFSHSGELGASTHLRAFAAHGSILCSRNDETTFEACNPIDRSDLTGVRSLDGASVQVKTHLGAQLALEPRTSVVLAKGAQSPRSSRVQLLEGRIDVTVPKLGAGREFIVQAPAATITVHGTAFTVTVVPRNDRVPATCVELREGVITVQSSNKAERLVAPARWGCDSTANTAPTTERDDSATGDSATASESIGATAHAAGTSAAEKTRDALPDRSEKSRRKSSLARETKLLQLGLGAEQRNDLTSAEKHYRVLLKQYPDSVVAPEARAALERIGGKKSSK